MAPTITMRRGAGRDRDTYTAKPSPERLDGLAHWMDSRFSLFGIRFGLDGILGLVPGIGDMVGLGMSAYLIGEGYRMGARKRTIARMAMNALGDGIVGSIPVFGSIVDVFWKANRANMRLLKRDLERPEALSRH